MFGLFEKLQNSARLKKHFSLLIKESRNSQRDLEVPFCRVRRGRALHSNRERVKKVDLEKLGRREGYALNLQIDQRFSWGDGGWNKQKQVEGRNLTSTKEKGKVRSGDSNL